MDEMIVDEYKVTIEFIQSTKAAVELDPRTNQVPIMPRMEDALYFHDCEQSEVLFGVSN